MLVFGKFRAGKDVFGGKILGSKYFLALGSSSGSLPRGDLLKHQKNMAKPTLMKSKHLLICCSPQPYFEEIKADLINAQMHWMFLQKKKKKKKKNRQYIRIVKVMRKSAIVSICYLQIHNPLKSICYSLLTNTTHVILHFSDDFFDVIKNAWLLNTKCK